MQAIVNRNRMHLEQVKYNDNRQPLFWESDLLKRGDFRHDGEQVKAEQLSKNKLILIDKLTNIQTLVEYNDAGGRIWSMVSVPVKELDQKEVQEELADLRGNPDWVESERIKSNPHLAFEWAGAESISNAFLDRQMKKLDEDLQSAAKAAA